MPGLQMLQWPGRATEDVQVLSASCDGEYVDRAGVSLAEQQ